MTYGFIGMLIKLLKNDGSHLKDEDGRVTHVAVALELEVGGDHGILRSR